MLHARIVGQGRPLVIVHGLFGSGDNWSTLAGKFPGRQVFLPDLRNHGQSPWSDSFTFADLASDLAEAHTHWGLEPCPWVGHSLGGKAVMELALSQPTKATGIAVLDMATRASGPHYTGFVPALRALDLDHLVDRSDAQQKLEASIPDRATLQFLLKSLVPGPRPGTWKWRLNLQALEDEFPEIWKALNPGRQWTGPTLFLSGGNSDYFLPQDQDGARTFFPNAQFQVIEGAGHWLHAEKPVEVITALNQWLGSLP